MRSFTHHHINRLFALSLSALWCVHSLCFASSVPHSFSGKLISILLFSYCTISNFTIIQQARACSLSLTSILVFFCIRLFSLFIFAVRSFGVLVLVCLCEWISLQFSTKRNNAHCVSVSVPFYLIFQIQSLSCTGLLLCHDCRCCCLYSHCVYSMLSLRNLTSFPLLIPFYCFFLAFFAAILVSFKCK